VERGTVRVKGLAQEHNMTFGTKTGLLDPETSALNMRPPHLPLLPTKELTI